MLSLANVATADTYGPATELKAPRIVRLDFDIGAGAAIRYQFGHGWPGVQWGGPELFKGPGRDSLARECTGVRVRSAVAGVPAQVTIDAVQEWD